MEPGSVTSAVPGLALPPPIVPPYELLITPPLATMTEVFDWTMEMLEPPTLKNEPVPATTMLTFAPRALKLPAVSINCAPLLTTREALAPKLKMLPLPAVPLTKLLPPFMIHLPLTVMVVFDAISIFAATALAALEVIRVPPLRLKNELVCAPKTTLVTSNWLTTSVPLLRLSVPAPTAPTLSWPPVVVALVTYRLPPETLTTLPVEEVAAPMNRLEATTNAELETVSVLPAPVLPMVTLPVLVHAEPAPLTSALA